MDFPNRIGVVPNTVKLLTMIRSYPGMVAQRDKKKFIRLAVLTRTYVNMFTFNKSETSRRNLVCLLLPRDQC